MTRGDKPATRVHYKGNGNDFVIFAESPDIVHRWKKDRSVPLMEVVDSFHVFTTYVPPPPPYTLTTIGKLTIWGGAGYWIDDIKVHKDTSKKLLG